MFRHIDTGNDINQITLGGRQIDTINVIRDANRNRDIDVAPAKVAKAEAACIQVAVKSLRDRDLLRRCSGTCLVLIMDGVRQGILAAGPMLVAETLWTDDVVGVAGLNNSDSTSKNSTK